MRAVAFRLAAGHLMTWFMSSLADFSTAVAHAAEPDCHDGDKSSPKLDSDIDLRMLSGQQVRLRMKLGSKRSSLQTQTVRYAIAGEYSRDVAGLVEGSFLEVSLTPVTRKHDGVQVQADFLVPEAKVVGSNVHLRVCINPGGLRPALYETAVYIDHPQLHHDPIALEIALRDSRDYVQWLIVVFACLLGTIVVLLRNPGLWSKTSERRAFVLHLIFGTIATLLASYVFLFDHETFGSSSKDYIEAFVAALGAFLVGEGVLGASSGIRSGSIQELREEGPLGDSGI
jgi:hypothetical protein